MKEYLEGRINDIQYTLAGLDLQIEELKNKLKEKEQEVLVLKTKSDTYREVLEEYKKEMYEPT